MFRSGWLRRGPRRHALGATAPVDDFGFVDLIAGVLGGGEARGLADGTVDVDHAAAGAADEVVVVVADAVLIAGRRAGRLDAPQDALVGQRREGLVYGLPGDGAARKILQQRVRFEVLKRAA